MATAAAVGVKTSLLLEDSAGSTVPATVEFCCDGAGSASELPLAVGLRFLWAVWRRVMALAAVEGG